MSFDHIAYNEIHQLREHFKLIFGDFNATAFVFNPGITGGSLQAWLATPANNTAFAQMCATYIGPAALIANTTTWAVVAASSNAMAVVAASSNAMAVVAASETAMAAVAASETAMAAVAASSTAMAAVAASSTAMAAVIARSTAMAVVAASETAMAAVAASSTALMAMHGSDTALNAIKGSAPAMNAMRASSKYIASAGQSINGTGVTITALSPFGKYILLGLSSSMAEPSTAIAVNTTRPSSALGGAGMSVPSKSSDAKRIDLAIPLVSPFTATSVGGYPWNFGAIRCDV